MTPVACCIILRRAPWYQRFGLDHNHQLLDAMLPWYGAANNRLIRDPANVALRQVLSALVNSAPNSDQRAQLAKPGYDQLKAWLMMARPDKADGAFFAQTMKAVQPTRMGISTGLWQSLAPDLWAFYLPAARAARVEDHSRCATGQSEPSGSVAADRSPQCRKHLI
jgi:type VI protein secretion system component VasK